MAITIDNPCLRIVLFRGELRDPASCLSKCLPVTAEYLSPFASVAVGGHRACGRGAAVGLILHIFPGGNIMFAGFAAVHAGPRFHLMPTHLISALRPAPRLLRRVLQLSIPLAVTLAAFPALTVHGWQVLSDGGGPAAMLLAVVVCAVVGIVLGAAPAPGEPNVHDRQLDIILAVFFIGGCVWLATAWSEQFRVGQPLAGPQLIAATALLTGAYLVVAGTRLTARLRYVLLLPLIAMPQVTARPTLLALLVTLTLVATLLLTLLRLRRNARASASATAESASAPTANAVRPPAPGAHPAPALHAADHPEGNPPARTTTPRASGHTPHLQAVRAMATETGSTR